ncbi:MAG: hypothetical protein ACT4P4_09635 [Betaproteobacteria bacterium]
MCTLRFDESRVFALLRAAVQGGEVSARVDLHALSEEYGGEVAEEILAQVIRSRLPEPAS